MSQFRVFLELIRQSVEPFIRKQVLVEHNGAKIRVRPEIAREHTHRVVLHARLGEINRPNVVVANQLEGCFYKALRLFS